MGGGEMPRTKAEEFNIDIQLRLGAELNQFY
jgi:hypothetical protein